MKVPYTWLLEYVDVDINSIDVKKLGDMMTMSGSKVETIENPGDGIKNVVTGKILSIEEHPDADKLAVAKVDTGVNEIQVVTGAKNIKINDIVPVALPGALLPGGIKIKKGKLRGVLSEGMMCSVNELNLTKNDYPDACEDGIFILDNDLGQGIDIKKVLGLDEEIIDFEITPNRQDCYSVTGLSREAAVTLQKEYVPPEITVKEKAGGNVRDYADVKIHDADLCPRYAARIVKNVRIEPSPEWMRKKLRNAGVRPINNIVDITNYVMLELGQPMHAFDINDIKGRKINVRRALKGETIETLDDENRKLDTDMLVIADEEKPIAVAGVMGGANSEIRENTGTILLESANFNSVSVRLTAKKLGMRTESSGRFEKGLDPENVIDAVNRAAQLIEEFGAGDVVKGIIDANKSKLKLKVIDFNPDRINEFLGAKIPCDFMVKVFKLLGFDVDLNSMEISIPSFRPDIEGMADLAEEAARFYGYNNIKATLLDGKVTTQGKKSRKQKIRDIIRDTMVSCGLYEIITYSFTSPKVFDMLNLNNKAEERKAVVIRNPLGEDYGIMRTTTIPEMMDVLARNYNRNIKGALLFEMGYVYVPKESIDELPTEKMKLTIGSYGSTDFYGIKGIIEELFKKLGIKDFEFKPEEKRREFHPGRTADICINGIDAGILGEIHPKVVKNFEAAERTYIAVLDIEEMIRNTVLKREFKMLPKYPSVERDISLLADDKIPAGDIQKVIRQNGGSILENITLFDIYRGQQVGEELKSISYSISFRAPDRTLTDEEVNKVMDKILNALDKNYGIKLREH